MVDLRKRVDPEFRSEAALKPLDGNLFLRLNTPDSPPSPTLHRTLRLPRSHTSSAISPDQRAKQNTRSRKLRADGVLATNDCVAERAFGVLHPGQHRIRPRTIAHFSDPRHRVAIKVLTSPWRVLTILSSSAWGAWAEMADGQDTCMCFLGYYPKVPCRYVRV